MRRRHSAQGARNDLNGKLGLPKRAGWGDYLRSRGLKPDTVHNWFKNMPQSRRSVCWSVPPLPRRQICNRRLSPAHEPRLFRVYAADRILIVAATSARQATAILHKSMDGLTDDDARVEELGQVIEIMNGRIRQRQARQIPQERAVSEKAILKALAGNPEPAQPPSHYGWVFRLLMFAEWQPNTGSDFPDNDHTARNRERRHHC